MTLSESRRVSKALGDLRQWAKRCHEASLQIVKGADLKGARVARGWATGVPGQHSWVVIGDPYNQNARVIDPTLWSYIAPAKPVIWEGFANQNPHTPHGAGSIWEWGRPADRTGKEIRLRGLSEEARDFLKLAAPRGLDWGGWCTLAQAPVLGWPSKEIIAAMYKSKTLSAAVPIDIVGMRTDCNPGGLYLP